MLFRTKYPEFQRFPTGLRDPLRIEGYPDDVQEIDQLLYKKVLSYYEKTPLKEEKGIVYCEVEKEKHISYADLDGEPPSKWFIGRKYLVILTYLIK